MVFIVVTAYGDMMRAREALRFAGGETYSTVSGLGLAYKSCAPTAGSA